MALDNDPTHANMFKIFAPDVLNSSQNKKWCTCTAHQLSNFSFIWRLLLFRSTTHSTLNI